MFKMQKLDATIYVHDSYYWLDYFLYEKLYDFLAKYQENNVFIFAL